MMLYTKKLAVLLIISVFCSYTVFSQKKKYGVYQAHSHNDYLQAMPFYAAYNAGFGSIEADIFPIGGDLLIGHTAAETHPSRTLNSGYLVPLKKEIKNSSTELQLLIDIKTDPGQSMSLLLKQLKPLKKHLSTPHKKGKLKIVITGMLPNPEDYKDYPLYIFFDNDLKVNLTDEQWQRVGMVSVNFRIFSKWKGTGPLAPNDLVKLQAAVSRAHEKNKAFRFWAAPDNQNSWTLQKELNVDWIGTDHIPNLSKFLAVN